MNVHRRRIVHFMNYQDQCWWWKVKDNKTADCYLQSKDDHYIFSGKKLWDMLSLDKNITVQLKLTVKKFWEFYFLNYILRMLCILPTGLIDFQTLSLGLRIKKPNAYMCNKPLKKSAFDQTRFSRVSPTFFQRSPEISVRRHKIQFKCVVPPIT